MARRRGRKTAMAAAGLATAASALLFGQQVAGAAVTTARDEESLTFVTFSAQAVTCTVAVEATHDTDNPNQPELSWATVITGQPACFEFSTVITATYKDSEGVTRTLTYRSVDEPTGGSVTGAYTATSVRADVDYRSCNPNESASCNITVIASPK